MGNQESDLWAVAVTWGSGEVGLQQATAGVC